MKTPNCSPITTFKDLMSEVSYSWDYDYEIIKTKEGHYSLNKLYIAPEYVTYKMDCYDLAPGVFAKFEKFYELLQE